MMTADAWSEAFREAGALAVTRPDPKRTGLALSAHLPPGSLVPAAQRLYDEGYSLLFITTADYTEGFLVTYVFDSFHRHLRLALRVLVKDKASPEVPSVAHVFQGAEWHERESYDFYGVVFTGNPNLVPILFPGDDRIPPQHRKAPDAVASIRKIGFLGEPEWAVDGWELAPEPAPAKAEAKPAEARPAPAKAEAKPADAKPAEARPEAAKPDAKPAEAKPAEAKADAKPEAKPAEAKPEAKPVEAKADAKPEEKPDEAKPAEAKPAGGGKEEGK